MAAAASRHWIARGMEARGWDALPLAPRELTRLLPQLWQTAKAAER
jgi:hypothetical protein